MTIDRRQQALRSYEVALPAGSSIAERFFPGFLLLTLVGCVFLGLYLRAVKLTPEEFTERTEDAIKTRFVIEERAKPKPPPPKPKPLAVKTEPIDLTTNPVLGAKQDDAAKNNPPKGPVVRRVYGLRRVYSVGIGAGGSMADAVIGKLGNTVNKEFDTVTATKQEIKGRIVSATTISKAPVIRRYVKPQYTKEMIDNRVEGTIKVRVMVDVDGKVKRAEVLNDLGFGSAQEALKACLSMEFEPAMQGDEAVATTIIVPVKFVLLG